jgi:hypothetical protein
MKKVGVLSLCGLLSVIACITGCLLHGFLLSIFDDTHAVYWDGRHQESDSSRSIGQLVPPVGFTLSPAEAEKIYTMVLGHATEGGVDIYIYADSDSYYVASNLPPNIPRCSYYVRLLGERINGNDGQVYDKAYRKWQRVGYLRTRKSSLSDDALVGLSKEDIIAKFGRPANTYQGSAPTEQRRDIWQYWCEDGELRFVFEDRVLIRVDSDIEELSI